MTDLTVIKQDKPDFLKSVKPNELTKTLAGGGGTNKRISIRGGVFRMMVGGEEVRKSDSRSLQVIVVNGGPKVARQFYAGAYNADNASTPDCWSNDGVAPDAKAADKQSPRCSDCKNNTKGSATGGGRACRFLQRLAVQIVGDVTNDVYQIVLPSQSIFGTGDKNKMPFQQYAKMLGANGENITTVITEMSFDTDSATPKLVFDATGYVTEEQYNLAIEAGKSEAALRAIVFHAAQTDGGKVTNALTAPPAPVAEPKKRPTTKAEAPVPKKELADVMKEWAE